MFGFLNISKPKDITSHDVVSKLRKELQIKRVGHAGTLDPMATGVLVIGINESTRLFEYLKSDKEYIAEITFGISTDTDDITGKVINSSDLIPSLNAIEKELKKFHGKVMQKPPIYSAIKIQGKKAYDLARKEKITLAEIKEKEVTINKIEILEHKDKKLKLKIDCSNGTYIRSIARDLGEKLNAFGTLSSLSRSRVGSFHLADSLSIESITQESINELLISPASALDINELILCEDKIVDINHGKTIKVNDKLGKNDTLYKLLNKKNDLIGIGISEGDQIKPKKVFHGRKKAI